MNSILGEHTFASNYMSKTLGSGTKSPKFTSGSLGVSRGLKRKYSSSIPSDVSFNAPTASSENMVRSVNLDSLSISHDTSQIDSSSHDTSQIDSSDFEMDAVQSQDFQPTKEVAVGAGAKIRQSLPVDKYDLDTWKNTPDAVMTIYFVFQEEFDKMAAEGFNDFSDKQNGMLNGLPVG
jgi:hypothetical protein